MGHKDADAARFKAVLAAEIIKALDRERVALRAAHGRTGIAADACFRVVTTVVLEAVWLPGLNCKTWIVVRDELP